MNFLAGAKRTAPQVGWSQEEADAETKEEVEAVSRNQSDYNSLNL